MTIRSAYKGSIVAVIWTLFVLLAPSFLQAENPTSLQSPEDLTQQAPTCTEGTLCDQFAIPDGKEGVCYTGTCRANTCVGAPRSVLFENSITKVNDCAESPAECVNGSIQKISTDPANWKPMNTGQTCTGASPDGNLCTAPKCVGIQCLEANVPDGTGCGATQADQCKTTTFGCVSGSCQAQVTNQPNTKACALASARTGPCDPAPACNGGGTCEQGPPVPLCCGNGLVEAAAGEQCEGASASCVNCKCVAQSCPAGQTWSMASCSCVPVATPTATATPSVTPDPRLLSVTVRATSPYQLRTSDSHFATNTNFDSSATASLATNPDYRPTRAVGPACNLDNLTITWTSTSASVCYLASSPVDPNANFRKVGTSGSYNAGRLTSSRQYAVGCYNSRNQKVTAAAVINLSRPSNWSTNKRWEMIAAFGAPNSNDSFGILAQDTANPANTQNMIYQHLMRACTNLGYDTYDGGRVGIYYGGFNSPSNNTVCWIANPRPSSGSDITCQNAATAGDPDYIGSFTCLCSP